MNVSDIINAAQERTPNLTVYVGEGEDRTEVVFRNIVLMAPERRKKLLDSIEKITDSSDESQDIFTRSAQGAREFMLEVCANKKADFNKLAAAFRADPDLEEAAWSHLFTEYMSVTQLGEADSSQTS